MRAGTTAVAARTRCHPCRARQAAAPAIPRVLFPILPSQPRPVAACPPLQPRFKCPGAPPLPPRPHEGASAALPPGLSTC